MNESIFERTGVATKQVLGGRYRIDAAVIEDSLGGYCAATDLEKREPVTVRVLDPRHALDEAIAERLRRECKIAARVNHPSVFSLRATGTLQSGGPYFVYDPLEGAALDATVKSLLSSGGAMSVKRTERTLLHLCDTLAATHKVGGVWGVIRPASVRVLTTGRIRMADLALAKALVLAGAREHLTPFEQRFIPPDLGPSSHDARLDVFCVAAIGLFMLTGGAPSGGPIACSQSAQVSVELDAVLQRALDSDPNARYKDILEFREALVAAFAAKPEILDVERQRNSLPDLEIDIELERNSLAGTPGLGVAPVSVSPSLSQAEVDSLAERARLLAKDTSACWTLVKNKLDHGPFAAQEIIHMILHGEALGDHELIHLSTRKRWTVAEHPDFGPFLSQYELRKQEQAHAQALDRSKKVEKVSNVAKVAIGAGAVALIGVLIAGYALTRGAASKDDQALQSDSDLYQRGQGPDPAAAGLSPAQKKRRGGKRAGGGAGPSAAGGGAAGTSYEEAMNRPMELGDVTKAGGEARLSAGDVQGAMNRRINSFYSCVGEGVSGKVTIDLAIAGDGQVLGSSVNQGGAGFRNCIQEKVRQVRFPTFAAPRMGARFSFVVE